MNDLKNKFMNDLKNRFVNDLKNKFEIKNLMRFEYDLKNNN